MITSSIFCFSYVFEGGGRLVTRLGGIHTARRHRALRVASCLRFSAENEVRDSRRCYVSRHPRPVFEVEIVDAFLAAKAAFAKFRS